MNENMENRSEPLLKWLRLLMYICIILLAVTILLSPIMAISIYGKVQNFRIRNDVFAYVLENKNNIELHDKNDRQEFFFTATGLSIGGVEYGYYYSPDDDYSIKGESYKKGYRINGIPDEPTDWYYTERICENWFYYELHDG